MIYVGLGANLPSPDYNTPQATLAAALERFAAAGVTVVARSPWYRSAPVPRSGQPWFVNGVAAVETALAPGPLLSALHGIEAAFGRVRRGYVGVATQPVRLPEALAQQVGQETGLLVVSVEASSPADSAGVLLGDILVGLEGKPLRSLDELLASLSDDRIGVAMPLTIVRGGQARELTLTIGERS